MKIIHFDRKTNELKLVLDNVDDLWHLSKIIGPGDGVQSRTVRSYKVGNKEEKKPVTIMVEVAQIEFSPTLNRLRMLGKIVSGEPEEFVQLGKHHTIEAEPGTKLLIIKNWKTHHLDRLKKAEKETKKPKIRIIVLDEEKALNAILRSSGIDFGAEFYSNVSKRDDKADAQEKSYFGQIASEIERHPEKYVIAGPGFTKDNLRKFLQQKKPELLNRIMFESCSYAERNGVNELLKNGILDKILGEENAAKEEKLITELVKEIHRDSGLAVYGLKETRQAAEAFAVKTLLILDDYLRTNKEAEQLVEQVYGNKAEVVFFSEEGEPGFKLKGFGKIAALLKLKMR